MNPKVYFSIFKRNRLATKKINKAREYSENKINLGYIRIYCAITHNSAVICF